MNLPTWKTSGIVDSLDLENGTITFWMSDFDELQTVPSLYNRNEKLYHLCLNHKNILTIRSSTG